VGTLGLAERYRRFAEDEARGSSPLYQELANQVAASPAILAFLSAFPEPLQQPNLFLAALRLAAGTPTGAKQLDELVLRHANAIAQTMRTRTTQTNEPGRCAALLPVLSQISGPIALLEVGASAGLCLLPDKYAYDFGRLKIEAPSDAREIAPTLRCQVSENVPLPDRALDVVWRTGLDLNPLGVDVAEDMAWLATLVWPEQLDRLARLRSAIDVARKFDPAVSRGDLRTDLTALAAKAPSDATLVIFHTAVLAYVQSQEERDAFARSCAQLGATWICNEWPYVFPAIAEKAGVERRGMFLMSVDGRPVAWTTPHGQTLEWIEQR
jgi:hypothetical protein